MVQTFVVALLAAGLAGMYTAAWGAYKDAPIERFNRTSFWRSLLFSVGIIVALWTPPAMRARVASLHMVEVFFLVMGLERIAIEIYKPCFRREDQSKYLIPQNFSFFGRRVEGDGVLWTIGLAMIATVAALVSIATPITGFAAHLIVACATGLFICITGAGKDAPFEGFDPAKFFRSVKVLAVMSPVLWLLGPRPLGLLVFMYGGVERLLVEGYKTYFTRKPPGKFRRDLPVVDHRFVAWRGVLRVLAYAIVGSVVALYAAAVA
jgi:hypothetical protein